MSTKQPSKKRAFASPDSIQPPDKEERPVAQPEEVHSWHKERRSNIQLYFAIFIVTVVLLFEMIVTAGAFWAGKLEVGVLSGSFMVFCAGLASRFIFK